MLVYSDSGANRAKYLIKLDDNNCLDLSKMF